MPLLRPGLNPYGAYTVSFVYINAGASFAKTGSYEMTLPKLDVPVNLLTWEVSLPDRLEVKQFGGNALSAELFPAAAQNFVADWAATVHFWLSGGATPVGMFSVKLPCIIAALGT